MSGEQSSGPGARANENTPPRMPGAPGTTPDFLLSHATGSVRSTGSRHTTSDPDEARALLASGAAGIVVGALPFDTSAPVALTVPDRWVATETPLEPPAFYRGVRPPTTRVVRATDSRTHLSRVSDAVTELGSDGPLDKVVLARELHLRADTPIDAAALAARFIDLSPTGDGFLADLSPAGPEYTGHRLVGSSPELLIRRKGPLVEAFPLAGSAARTGDADTDLDAARALTESAKDQVEHAYVVESLRESLGPLCRAVSAPPTPMITSTRSMLHLGTPVTAELRSTDTTALDLARAVHPTPAVCGHPTELAADWIRRHEGDRRFYAGAVGWCDAAGDGTWVVAIRCLELAPDGLTATAWAGGGIVAASNPVSEYRETEAKFRAVLDATGVSRG